MSDEKMVTGVQGKAIVRKVKRILSPNRQTIYSNSTIVFGNQWDIQMYFGLMSETSPDTYETIDQALVIMTPEHALAFSKALQENLRKFEEHGGKIREVKKVEVPEEALEN